MYAYPASKAPNSLAFLANAKCLAALLSDAICCYSHHTRQDRLPDLNVDDDDPAVLWVLRFRCSHGRDPREPCGLLALPETTLGTAAVPLAPFARVA